MLTLRSPSTPVLNCFARWLMIAGGKALCHSVWFLCHDMGFFIDAARGRGSAQRGWRAVLRMPPKFITICKDTWESTDVIWDGEVSAVSGSDPDSDLSQSLLMVRSTVKKGPLLCFDWQDLCWVLSFSDLCMNSRRNLYSGAHFRWIVCTRGSIFNRTHEQPAYLFPFLKAPKCLGQTHQFWSNSSAISQQPLKISCLLQTTLVDSFSDLSLSFACWGDRRMAKTLQPHVTLKIKSLLSLASA